MTKAGFAPEIVSKCLLLAQEIIQYEYGILLQLFTPSLEFLDDQSYICTTCGTPLGQIKTSEFLESFDAKNYENSAYEEEKYILHHQIRLLMTNSCALNPHSWLSVKMNTLLPEQILKEFRLQLRVLIDEAVLDIDQSKLFKEQLEDYWKYD